MELYLAIKRNKVGFVRKTNKQTTCAKDMNNLLTEKDKMTKEHKEHAQPSRL